MVLELISTINYNFLTYSVALRRGKRGEREGGSSNSRLQLSKVLPRERLFVHVNLKPITEQNHLVLKY